MSDDNTAPKLQIDHSGRGATAVVGDQLGRVRPWRSAAARLYARSQHRTSNSDQERLLEEIAAIEADIHEAREIVADRLKHAPLKVKSHSHIVDFDRAMDNLEAALTTCRGAIEAARQRT